MFIAMLYTKRLYTHLIHEMSRTHHNKFTGLSIIKAVDAMAGFKSIFRSREIT